MTKLKTRLHCFAGAAALGAFALAPAHAQTGDEDDPVSRYGVDDIVVTAQRREQSFQETPLSIQVLGPEEMQRGQLSQAVDLNRLVPGIQIGAGGNAAQIYIRGVGDFAGSALSNPAVAVNIDGVYIARPQAVNSSFFDLARVEVLRGPQGTLYGRNASGGAINLITNRPQLGELSGHATFEYGNYSRKRGEGAINLPIGETAALRASFGIIERDGYLSDGNDDDVKQAFRLRFLWEPSETVSVLLNADYADEDGRGPGTVMLPRIPNTDPWLSSSSPEANAILTTTPPLGFIVPPVGTDSFRDNQFWSVSAEVTADLGFATLTVLPSYRDAVISERNYPAGLRNTIPEGTSEATSIEARLSNETDILSWVAGFYYFNEKQVSEQQIYEGILQDIIIHFAPEVKSYAAFGQATFSVTDWARVTGGLRYTDESSTVVGDIFTNSPIAVPPMTPLPALLEEFGGKVGFDSLTWKAGVELDIGPDSMVFFNASTGFKAGGHNQTVEPLATYDPEKLRALEFGLRNRFFDGRLQVNAELFHWTYENGQVASVVFDPLGQITLLTQNAGNSKIKGGNIDIVARPTPNDTFRFFAEYNDAQYKDFSYDTAFSIFGSPLFNPASSGCTPSAPFPGANFGTLLTTLDCSGFQMARTPEFTATASYDHVFDLAGGATLTPHVDMQYASERWLSTEFVPSVRADGYTLFNADLTYVSPGGIWSLSVFGRNLTDKPYYTGGSLQAFVPPLAYVTIGAPRTYGGRISVSF
jgi:iron complex outermembrane receptor protein